MAQHDLLTSSRFLDCFQYCSKALRLLGSIIVLVVIAIVAFSLFTVLFFVLGPVILGGNVLQIIGATLVCTWVTVVVSCPCLASMLQRMAERMAAQCRHARLSGRTSRRLRQIRAACLRGGIRLLMSRLV